MTLSSRSKVTKVLMGSRHTSQQKQPNEPVRRRHAGKVIAALTVFGFVLASGLVLVSTFSSISDCTHIDKKIEESDITNQSRQDFHERSRAVIHMGVHKTGTTSIQKATETFKEELREDGYEMPWAVNMNRWEGESSQTMHWFANQATFASCFLAPHSHGLPCVSDLLLSGIEIGNQGKNLLVSAETFSKIDPEGLRALSAYLSPWDDVVVVIYYRRYYDYTISAHNQRVKGKWRVDPLTGIATTTGRNYTASIVDTIIGIDKVIPLIYTTEVVSRVRKYFDNVVIINMHDDSHRDNNEKFFCEAVPDAKRTCDAVVHSEEVIHTNTRRDLIYKDLTYAASKKRLLKSITTDREMEMVSNAVQKYQEKTLNLTKYDFDMNCLPPETQEWMLNKSLEIERLLFPGFFNSPKGEADLRADFEIKSKYSLCKIDANTTLQKREWKEFFQKWAEN